MYVADYKLISFLIKNKPIDYLVIRRYIQKYNKLFIDLKISTYWYEVQRVSIKVMKNNENCLNLEALFAERIITN